MKSIYSCGYLLAILTVTQAVSDFTNNLDLSEKHFNLTFNRIGQLVAGGKQGTDPNFIESVDLNQAPAPEINLVGNGLNITNNDITPSTTDDTDLGSACVNGTEIIKIFTIQNTGDDILSLFNPPAYVSITGPDAASFTIHVFPASTIPMNGNTSFQVKFLPLSAGVKNATLVIQNNDADENPFSFSIRGTGVAAPVISTQPVTQITTSPMAVNFSVTASNVAAYQWQQNSGAGWSDIAAGSPYAGTTSATLNIHPALGELDGTMYQCILHPASPCADLVTAAAGLVVSPGPCINDATGYSGWSLSGASIAANQACSGTGILFNAAAENAVTPVIMNPRFLNFSQKRSTNTTPWELKIQVGATPAGPWIDVASSTTISSVCTAAIMIDLTAFTGARYIRFLDARPGAGAEERGIDDISITCGSYCPAVHTVSGFVPSTAPPSAVVTISGTNFIGATAVRFGTVAASSFAVINATTISAVVPPTAPPDHIVVVKDGCETRSSLIFSPIGTAGTCGKNGSPSIVTDLFISEIFDAEAGSLQYIELFNGTASSVNLGAPNNYVLQVKTGITASFSLTGTIGSGATYLVKLGNNGSCSGVTPQLQDNTSFGFNGNDEVLLLKNGATGTIIDYVPNPNFGGLNQPGFTQRRKGNTAAANLPAATYTPGDWMISFAEDCSHLGIPPYAVSSASNIIISTQPQDVNCSAINFAVGVTGSGPGVNSVLWKYTDPATMTGWSNVGNLNGTLGLTTGGTNTSSMTISGSISQLLNYQFYAEVQRGSCISSSDAVQYTYDTKPVYRSNAVTGAWNTPGNWLMADNTTGPFISTCAYPTALNATAVIIRANDHITLPMDVDVNGLTIENQGTLEISTSGKLKINNGATNADLVVNGTLLDRGSAGNGVQFSTGATWLLGSTAGNTGTIIKTNTSSVTGYRDNYFGGIGAMASTPSWYFRYNGDGNPNVAAVDMFYPNLFFENTANTGTFSWNTAFMSLDGATSNTVVQGNLNIGTTGVGRVAVYNNNIHPSPLLVKGNLIVGASSLLTNQSYNNITDATHGCGTGIEVQGNVLVNGTLTLSAKDSGLLKFSGSANQEISGSGVTNLQDISFANSMGVVAINKSISIPGVFTVGPNSKLELQAANVTLTSTVKQTARVAAIGAGAGITYTGPGRFVVERFYTPRRAWRLVTAPVTVDPGKTIFSSWQKAGLSATGEGMYVSGPLAPIGGLDLSVQGNYSMYTYSGSSLSGIANTITQPISGVAGLPNKPDNFGMFVFIRGDRSSTNLFFPPNVNSTTLRDTGKIQIHDQVFNLTSSAGGYSLVGNPYASPVDINSVLAGSTNLVKTRFYAYDPYLNSSQGGYITFTRSGPGFVATPPSPGGLSSLIQSSQAFYVEHTGANATLIFREINKVTSPSNTVFRPVEQESSSLRINLLLASETQPTILADGVMVEYSNSWRNEVDENDAIKFPNTRENIAIKKGQKMLVVENRGPLENTDTIFLHLRNLVNANYQLEFTPTHFDPLLVAMLEDRYTGSKTLLNLAAKTSINFAVTGDTGSIAATRFCIVFQRVAAALPVNFRSISAVQEGSQVLVKWNVESEKDVTQYILERSEDARLYQPLATLPVKNQGMSSGYQWKDVDPTRGENYYRIRIINHSGEPLLSPVARVTINAAAGKITLLPRSLSGDNCMVNFRNMQQGKYVLSLIDQSGRVLAIKAVQLNRASQRELFPVAQTLASGLYRLRIGHPGGEMSWLDILF